MRVVKIKDIEFDILYSINKVKDRKPLRKDVDDLLFEISRCVMFRRVNATSCYYDYYLSKLGFYLKYNYGVVLENKEYVLFQDLIDLYIDRYINKFIEKDNSDRNVETTGCLIMTAFVLFFITMMIRSICG